MGIADSVREGDMRFAFLGEDFAEDVVYKPYNGTPRTIKAQVYRVVPEEIQGPGPGATGSIRIVVENHATRGTASINRDGDSISLPGMYGGTATDHKIVDVIAQDAAAWKLQLKGRAGRS